MTDTTTRASYAAPKPTPADHTHDLPQYSVRRILGIWSAAALPMAGLAWLVAPMLAHAFEGPTAWPRAIVLSLTAGLVWQFFLVLFLVHREQGSLRWAVAGGPEQEQLEAGPAVSVLMLSVVM